MRRSAPFARRACVVAAFVPLAVTVGCNRDVVEPPVVCNEAPIASLDRVPGAGVSAGPLEPLETVPSRFDNDFSAAASEFDVPLSLLRAIGWVETRWQMVRGGELPGRAAAFGVMALRGGRLAEGAALAGVSDDAARFDSASNIRAAAALLGAWAARAGIQRADPAAWQPLLARYSGIELPRGRDAYVRQVLGAAERGLRRLPGGELATAALPGAVAEGTATGQAQASGLAPPHVVADASTDCAPPDTGSTTDYAPAVWRPSPNFNARPADSTGIPRMIIIHTCEGAYTGCWSWLDNPVSQVSAHYVVDETGSEISQLVREKDRAWHIAAIYDCTLDHMADCWLNGVQSNDFTIGIEHAGYASQSSFPESQIEASAELVCDITRDRDIPRDWQHIVGHGQLQPENRTDPGEHWPWIDYMHRIQTACGETVVDDDTAYNDSTVAAVTVVGSWVVSDSTPDYYAAGYRWASTSPTTDDAVVFSFHLDAPATRTIDARWTPGANRSTAARYVVTGAVGDTLATPTADQTQDGVWHTLGTWSFPAGWSHVALLRRGAAGAVVVADAVRVRASGP
ncbi:MAG: N-acetylmuramoyl-L-alanine amidase [Gemmatimonadota bacterium]